MIGAEFNTIRTDWHEIEDCQAPESCELCTDVPSETMAAIQVLRRAGIRCSIGASGEIGLDERRDGKIDAQGFLQRQLA